MDDYGDTLSFVLLDVHLETMAPGTRRTMRFGAIVDSGATRCLFDMSLAEVLGIDPRSGDLQQINGIGGIEEIWLHDVMLDIPGGAVKVRAGFKENLPFPGLLGMSGFFENFTVTFDSVGKICVLDRMLRV